MADEIILTDEDNEPVVTGAGGEGSGSVVDLEAADTDSGTWGVVIGAQAEEGGRLRFASGNLKIPLATQTDDGRSTTAGLLQKAQIKGYGGLKEGTWQSLQCSLSNGTLTFPYIPLGVYSEILGKGVTWEELKALGSVRLHDGEAGRLGMTAAIVDNFLTFYVDRQ